jgi:hypothetical protein
MIRNGIRIVTKFMMGTRFKSGASIDRRLTAMEYSRKVVDRELYVHRSE